jgi:hypothetical protein
MGTALPNDLAKYIRNGQIRDAHGIAGDNNGLGVNAFSVTDYGQLGFCSNSAVATGPYNQICIGHNSAGKPILEASSMAGAPAQALQICSAGTCLDFPFVPPGSGVIGPSSTVIGHIATWANTTGTLLADSGPGLNQPSSANFWVDNVPPVVVDRMNDRLFPGAAANQYNANKAAPVHSWTGVTNSAIFQYLETNAQLSVISTIGEIAGFFAARTSETPSGNTCCSIPLAIFGNNDRTSPQEVQWGLYSTIARQAGAGTAINEFDGQSREHRVLSPYSGAVSGATVDLWLPAAASWPR